MFSFYFLKIGNLALGGRPHRALHNALELDSAFFLSVGGKQTGGVEREGQGGTVNRDTHCGS